MTMSRIIIRVVGGGIVLCRDVDLVAIEEHNSRRRSSSTAACIGIRSRSRSRRRWGRWALGSFPHGLFIPAAAAADGAVAEVSMAILVVIAIVIVVVVVVVAVVITTAVVAAAMTAVKRGSPWATLARRVEGTLRAIRGGRGGRHTYGSAIYLSLLVVVVVGLLALMLMLLLLLAVRWQLPIVTVVPRHEHILLETITTTSSVSIQARIT
mmetsp:Transcript_23820/g.39765  ORF Transcript_23820/g.39765 Transcript_23820/m.39765 type:complete len:210 (-) Transcript_23820:98-727(-)